MDKKGIALVMALMVIVLSAGLLAAVTYIHSQGQSCQDYRESIRVQKKRHLAA